MKRVVRNRGFPEEIEQESFRTAIIDRDIYNESTGGGLENSGW